MHSNVCFALVLVCLAAAQAIPAGKIETKSVADEPTLGTSNLKLEEAGDSKDRSKKSTFCVEIRPDGEARQAENYVQSLQTLNLVPQAQLATQVQLAPQVQTYNLQPVVQPMQALSVMQAPQLIQQSVYVPQQMASPVQTLHIIQSPQQPCPEARQTIIQQKTEYAPEPTTTPAPTTTTPRPHVQKIERPKPQHYALPPPERVPTMVNVERQVMHAEPSYYEQVVVVPPKPVMMLSEPQRLATLVNVPSCPHHSHQAGVSQCTCSNQGYVGARSVGMRTDPMHFARAHTADNVHAVERQQHFH